MIRVFEAFSGYGSQSLALERLGIEHKVVCISEIDKYAIQAYEALHGKTLNLGDISKIKAEDVPDHDLFTYSFPCQDISVAGNQKGLIEGQTRSGLLWECERIIEAKRPKYLLMENVKNLVSKKFIGDFKKWQHKLEMLGYTNYTKVLNAKDYGIPQNRERVFMISILGDHEPYEFPEPFDNGLRLKDFLEDEIDEKYYISKEKVEQLIKNLKGKLDLSKHCIGTCHEKNDLSFATRNRVYNAETVSPTLSATQYKDPVKVLQVGNVNPSGNGMNGQVYHENGLSPTLTTNKGEGPKIAIPCLTPDRIEKRQNGRRFKEDGEPMFTLTGQDRHGVLQVGNYREKEEGFTNPQTGRVYSADGCSPTLNTMQGGDRQPKIIVDDTQGFDGVRTYENYSPTLRSERNGLKTICNYRIRKLTPRECFGLMGLHDDEIDKIQATGISNSQQYKLAGNSIVVDVLEAIFKQLFLK